MLATKPGCNPFAHLLAEAGISVTVNKDGCPPQAKPVGEWAREAWNPEAKLPMFRWLNAEQTDRERDRLKTLGNLVVPRQAALAAHVLAQMQ